MRVGIQCFNPSTGNVKKIKHSYPQKLYPGKYLKILKNSTWAAWQKTIIHSGNQKVTYSIISLWALLLHRTFKGWSTESREFSIFLKNELSLSLYPLTQRSNTMYVWFSSCWSMFLYNLIHSSALIYNFMLLLALLFPALQTLNEFIDYKCMEYIHSVQACHVKGFPTFWL